MKSISSLILAVCLPMAMLAAPPVPRAASEFRIVDLSGKTVELSHYRGKVVVMQFLYTTCQHCANTAQTLSKLQTELGPRGLQVLGVAFNREAQEPSAIAEFVKNNSVDFPVGSATPETVFSYLGFSMMERFVVPQIVIVDRSGTVRAQSEQSGSPQLQDETYLRQFLKDLLAPSSAHRQ